jgi:hypothetical protein
VRKIYASCADFRATNGRCVPFLMFRSWLNVFLYIKGSALKSGISVLARFDTPFGRSVSNKTGHQVRKAYRDDVVSVSNDARQKWLLSKFEAAPSIKEIERGTTYGKISYHSCLTVARRCISGDIRRYPGACCSRQDPVGNP